MRAQRFQISRRNKTVVKENARLAKQLNEKTAELAVVKEKVYCCYTFTLAFA